MELRDHLLKWLLLLCTYDKTEMMSIKTDVVSHKNSKCYWEKRHWPKINNIWFLFAIRNIITMNLIAANELELIYAAVVDVNFCAFLINIFFNHCPSRMSNIFKLVFVHVGKVLNVNQSVSSLHKEFKHKTYYKLTTRWNPKYIESHSIQH